MTGDLGWLDDAGYLHLTGRKKEVIIRGGRNIHPARIEAAALRHEAIEKAAAFAIPDPRFGERVCLALVVRTGSVAGTAAILEHLHAAGLPKYEMPEFILSLPEMPLTASGKLLKRELVRRVAEGELQPTPVRVRSRTTDAA
jgi:acyl-CoA synthetase